MPTSYQAPMRGDAVHKKRTMSQSTSTNVAKETATVRRLLEDKGSSVFTIRPQDTIAEAVHMLRDKRIGALLVTDANGHVQGILSERDIVRKLAETPGQTLPQKVEENMTRDLKVCALDDTLIDVLRRMRDGGFRHMPVVEDEDLCGILTIGDVVNYRLKELEQEALQLKQLIVG